MAKKTARGCKEPGCAEIVYGGVFCPKHLKADTRKRLNYVHSKYHSKLHSTKTWQDLRRIQIRQQPFCVKCGSVDKLHIDHINPHNEDPDLFFDQDNLQTLCSKCHARKAFNGTKNS